MINIVFLLKSVHITTFHFLPLSAAILDGDQCSQKGSVDQERRILDAIQVVMYQDMGFHGNRKAFYDVNNSYIDKVCFQSSESI